MPWIKPSILYVQTLKHGMPSPVRPLSSTPNYLYSYQYSSVDLEKTVEDLRTELAKSHKVVRSFSILVQFFPYQVKEIANFETSIQQLRTQLSNFQQIAERFSTELASSQLVIRAHRLKHKCETLYADGHVIHAANTLLDITNFINDDIKSDMIIMDWLSGRFRPR